jgi:Mn-dependent DtxR family transcriptional regulator
LRLPEAIVAEAEASRVDSERSLDVQAVRDGLAELESRGLAEEEPGRGWRLTEAAR